MDDRKPRGETRTKALIRSRLRGAGSDRDACILDVSTRGLLGTCAIPPERGSFVELVANGHSLVGHVKWSNGRRFGIVLQDRISVTALIANDGGELQLGRTAAARKPRTSTVAALAADASSLARIATFAVLVLAALVAGLFLMRSTQATLGSFDKVNAAITTKH